MKKCALLMFLLLTACATPETILRDKLGNVVVCGGGTAGSIAGGLIGYRIQEGHDQECVQSYKAQGYSRIN
jgi:hypothetical protein